jgi:hypothetical protein
MQLLFWLFKVSMIAIRDKSEREQKLTEPQSQLSHLFQAHKAKSAHIHEPQHTFELPLTVCCVPLLGLTFGVDLPSNGARTAQGP